MIYAGKHIDREYFNLIWHNLVLHCLPVNFDNADHILYKTHFSPPQNNKTLIKYFISRNIIVIHNIIVN